MYNKELYEIKSDNVMRALEEIGAKAKKECRLKLRGVYKTAMKCPTMTNLIINEVGSEEGESLETLCSKYYLASFKEALLEPAGNHPCNFSTEIHLWSEGSEAVISAETSWGSSDFLDFLGSLPFLQKRSSAVGSKEPLMKMEILSPENYHQVDPAWGK